MRNRYRRPLLLLAIVVVGLAVGLGVRGFALVGGPESALAQMPASACCTQFGRCPLMGPRPLGSGCFCPSPYGPVGGFAC